MSADHGMNPNAITPVHLENLAYTLDLFWATAYPVATASEHQRKGIGSALVRDGLEQRKKLGCGADVVLGHPEYYPRFGFSPSARFGISCEYGVPEELFMIVELQPGFLHGASGKVKYHAAFSNL
jgi:putative acetyltransferase